MKLGSRGTTLTATSDRLGKAFDTLDRVQRYRGHFLNWYETNTLAPLPPRYVSTVDSGNLLVTNHEMLPQAFQQLVVDSGVKILYFSNYADSIVKNGKIQAVLVETPIGRAAVRGKVFIDCTGLATVAVPPTSLPALAR